MLSHANEYCATDLLSHCHILRWQKQRQNHQARQLIMGIVTKIEHMRILISKNSADMYTEIGKPTQTNYYFGIVGVADAFT